MELGPLKMNLNSVVWVEIKICESPRISSESWKESVERAISFFLLFQMCRNTNRNLDEESSL